MLWLVLGVDFAIAGISVENDYDALNGLFKVLSKSKFCLNMHNFDMY